MTVMIVITSDGNYQPITTPRRLAHFPKSGPVPSFPTDLPLPGVLQSPCVACHPIPLQQLAYLAVHPALTHAA